MDYSPTSLLCPWNSLGKYIGMGCYSLLQRIFLTQGSNLGLLHHRQTLSCLSHQGSPQIIYQLEYGPPAPPVENQFLQPPLLSTE